MKSKLYERLNLNLSKAIGYGIWILIVILAFSTVRNMGRVSKIKAQVQAEREVVAKMEKENTDLEAQIAKSSGADFVEKEMRDKLGLVKGGETIVILPDVETLRKLAPPEASYEEVAPDPNWRKWVNIFI